MNASLFHSRLITMLNVLVERSFLLLVSKVPVPCSAITVQGTRGSQGSSVMIDGIFCPDKLINACFTFTETSLQQQPFYNGQ